MSETEDVTLDDLGRAALARRYAAEADRHEAETEAVRLAMRQAKIDVAKAEAEWAFIRASDKEHHVYRFAVEVDQESVGICEEHLSRWSRLDGRKPKPMELIINSPGGSSWAGMDLFDFLGQLHDHGHEITITARGAAASMAAVLVQAASPGRRRMGREAMLLLHQPSSVAMGSLGEIHDTLEYLKILDSRVMDIFAARCAGSGAEAPLTLDELKAAVNRKDRWFSSDEALKGGLVDVVL